MPAPTWRGWGSGVSWGRRATHIEEGLISGASLSRAPPAASDAVLSWLVRGHASEPTRLAPDGIPATSGTIRNESGQHKRADASRGVVPGRGADRPEEHPDPGVGPDRRPARGPPRRSSASSSPRPMCLVRSARARASGRGHHVRLQYHRDEPVCARSTSQSAPQPMPCWSRLPRRRPGAPAGDSQALAIPNITLLALPPWPELNPVERIWHYLRSHWLTANSVFRSLADIMDACERAWNCFAADPGLIRSLCAVAWAPGWPQTLRALYARSDMTSGDHVRDGALARFEVITDAVQRRHAGAPSRKRALLPRGWRRGGRHGDCAPGELAQAGFIAGGRRSSRPGFAEVLITPVKDGAGVLRRYGDRDRLRGRLACGSRRPGQVGGGGESKRCRTDDPGSPGCGCGWRSAIPACTAWHEQSGIGRSRGAEARSACR